MISLVNLLILFFILLIVYQIFLACFDNIVEGLENNQYQPYDTNNPQNAMILAQQNAGNIGVLKQQIDGVMGLNKQVQDLSGNVSTLQTQVNGIVGAQAQYVSDMKPAKISGAVPAAPATS